MVQRYKFESKSQLNAHNVLPHFLLFPMVQRYKFESKSQHEAALCSITVGCFQWFKGTNLKANHNNWGDIAPGSKLFPMVQRYKFESKSQQFTSASFTSNSCFQWFKGTNLKANHNSVNSQELLADAVSNGSKVQI